jgi:hypothetical protein
MLSCLSKNRRALTALFIPIALSLSAAISFAGTPTVGPDCGIGAAIVGSDSAGKVTIGSPDPTLPATGTCNLSFGVPYTNAPSCTATNETNSGGHAVSVGVRTTTTKAEMDGMNPWAPGDVISYSCQEY